MQYQGKSGNSLRRRVVIGCLLAASLLAQTLPASPSCCVAGRGTMGGCSATCADSSSAPSVSSNCCPSGRLRNLGWVGQLPPQRETTANAGIATFQGTRLAIALIGPDVTGCSLLHHPGSPPLTPLRQACLLRI